jgi:hypothetical protein
MSKKLKWDEAGKKFYETGTKKGVLYVFKNGDYQPGVAWNGLTAVTESPSGAEATPLYADDIKYLNLMSAEEFGCTIEAYTYPDEFAECDGYAELGTGVTIGQQKRTMFAFSYVTTLGNDEENNEYGYKIHIVYGCLASPSEKGYSSINDSPEAITLSWEVTTTPIEVEGFKPTATITINSKKVTEAQLKAIEDKLYGTDETEPTLLKPADLVTILNENAVAG